MSEGTKHDQGKPRMSLIPVGAKREMAKAFTFGASKYAAYNWTGGISASRLLDSAQRHIDSVLDPNESDQDPESGLHHLGHALASIAMAYEMLQHRPDMDDRQPKIEVPSGKKA